MAITLTIVKRRQMAWGKPFTIGFNKGIPLLYGQVVVGNYSKKYYNV